MEKQFINSTNALLAFLRESVTPFHAVQAGSRILSDFIPLHEEERFTIEEGKSYLITRNGSALIAFRVPEGKAKGFSIISSHTDSPSFKVKQNPEYSPSGLYTTLNTEGYGGMLLSPWFDRPLSLAGRVYYQSEGGSVEGRLVNFDRDLVSIVNLAIHMNRDANKGICYDVQKELLPLFGMGNLKGELLKLLAQEAGVSPDRILDYDLYLYNRMPGSIWGFDNDFFSSGRIDDLQCAYTSLMALKNAKASDKIQLIALFDNEEVGSGTKQGALSDFLVSTIHRIGNALGFDEEGQYCLKASSMMLSADNCHGMHPNYAEKCDITNKPVLNGGIAIKISANQKYSTDAHSASIIKNILNNANVPYQDYVNNSSIPGGSTLGNLSQSQYSLVSADIGAANLAMHSPYESGGTKDTLYLEKGMQAFLENF